MDLITKVSTTLLSLNLPVQYEIRPKTFPGISFEFFNDAAALHGDGEAIQDSIAVQVDIWSKTPAEDIKNQVKAVMKADGFLYAYGEPTLEQDVKLYRCMLIFNHYQESEG